jgi:uncharacterized membrane protein
MIENSMQVLAEKMRLESQWNTSYLQNGRITADMNVLHERIRILRRKTNSIGYGKSWIFF